MGRRNKRRKGYRGRVGKRESETWARDGKWNFYLCISFTNLQLVKCQTLSFFFFFSTQVWASLCVERHCAKDSWYRKAEEGTFVCTGMVFLQAQEKSMPGHSWLIYGRLSLQPPRAGAGSQGPDVLNCFPSQNVTSAVCPTFSAVCPTFSLYSYCSSLNSVKNN